MEDWKGHGFAERGDAVTCLTLAVVEIERLRRSGVWSRDRWEGVSRRLGDVMYKLGVWDDVHLAARAINYPNGCEG